MANPSNHGSAVIRLACDPKFFPNSDGSETVRVTGYAENDFANKAGEVTSEKLSFERYLPNGKRGAFGHMHTGDLVGFGYRLATSDYTNAQGERVYGQGNLAIINSVKLYSSKRESDTRAAEQQQSVKPQESQAKQAEQQPKQQQQNQTPQQQQPREAQSAPQAQPQQQTSSQQQPNVQQQQQQQVPQQQPNVQQPQMPQQGLQPVNPAIAQQIIAQQQHNPNAPININQIARDLGQQPPMPPQQAQQQPPQVQQQPQQQAPAGPIGYPDIFSPKPPAAHPAVPQQVQPQMQQQAPVQQQQPQQPNLPPQIPQQAPQPQQQAPAQQPQQQQNQPGVNELPYGMGGVQQNPSMAARQEYNSTYSETLNANRANTPKGGFSAEHDDIPF